MGTQAITEKPGAPEWGGAPFPVVQGKDGAKRIDTYAMSIRNEELREWSGYCKERDALARELLLNNRGNPAEALDTAEGFIRECAARS